MTISISLLLAFFSSKSYSTPLLDVSSQQQLMSHDGTGSVVGSGLAWYSSNLYTGVRRSIDPSNYTCYSGSASAFPPLSTWISFSAMWGLQRISALVPIGDTWEEIGHIKNAIMTVSTDALVDTRVILAIIILESTGNVRVPCTTSYGGVQNCGLMQAYNPTQTSYNASIGSQSILQMVVDGTQGTETGPGLVQWLNHAAGVNFDASGNLWEALRGYNSGRMNDMQLSDGLGATDAYVSDVANYLQGWNGYGDGPAGCSFGNTSSSTSSATVVAITTCDSALYDTPPNPTAADSTSDCCTWVIITTGDTCSAILEQYNITIDQFYIWNPSIDEACDNLRLAYAYCVNSDALVTDGDLRSHDLKVRSIPESGPDIEVITSKKISTTSHKSSLSAIKKPPTTSKAKSVASAISRSASIESASSKRHISELSRSSRSSVRSASSLSRHESSLSRHESSLSRESSIRHYSSVRKASSLSRHDSSVSKRVSRASARTKSSLSMVSASRASVSSVKEASSIGQVASRLRASNSEARKTATAKVVKVTTTINKRPVVTKTTRTTVHVTKTTTKV